MNIEKIEIEVVQMTRDEEQKLWHEFENNRYDREVFVCGHKILEWDTDDSNNDMLLKAPDGSESWLGVSIIKPEDKT